MNTSLALVEGVLVMLSVILLANLLKRKNILQKEHSVLFSRLVMKVTLPALKEAAITSELGVGFLLFIFGPLIAMYYGESEVIKKDLAKSVKDFFISPIFIALISGIGFSFIRIDPNNIVFSVVDRFMVIVGNANTLLVSMAVMVTLILSVLSVSALFLWLF